MVRSILDSIIDEFSVGQCRRDIANHWACRATVPGPGMRAAGEILVRRYHENGVPDATLMSFPADDRTEFINGHRNPLEWRPHSASLRLLSPDSGAHQICCYRDEPMSLVCNSHPTPPGGIEADLVVHVGPLTEDIIQPGQWAGKIVLCNHFPSSVAGAVHRSGAVGILSDCVSPPWLQQHPPTREPEDVPDLVMWTIFSGNRGAPPLFGFNLSPRQGRRLRELAATSPTPLRLRAVVEAEFVEGSSDLVSASLPGCDAGDEEIWVLAHLSEPGARDNASGCCLSLELARVLAALTRSGSLPPLRRTVRFLHATEADGFLPYIHSHLDRLPNVLGGLCADSIAQDFGVCGGSMVLFLSPEQNASFVDGLMQYLLQTVADMPARRFSPDGYATYPWRTEPFFGNDAFIADGFFDVPTPQVSSWPDRYYHSNLDTVDQINPNVLGRSAAAMGAFLTLLATAGEEEALWFARLAAQDWKQRICARTNAALGHPERQRHLPADLKHLGLQARDAITQTRRFSPDSHSLQTEIKALETDIMGFAAREADSAARIAGLAPLNTSSAPVTPVDIPDRFAAVPRRLRWGAPSTECLGPEITEALDELQHSRGVDVHRVWLWINGRRSVAAIVERLEIVGKVEPEALLACLLLLEKAGVLAFVT